MFLNTSRHMPRYAGAADARMKRGAVSRTVASFVLAIGMPRHAVSGWIDWVGCPCRAGRQKLIAKCLDGEGCE